MKRVSLLQKSLMRLVSNQDHAAYRIEMINEELLRWSKSFGESSQSGIIDLQKSINYSLLKGGKRFRPVLCLLVAEAFGAQPARVLPWACAIEMIHTYSLIHDDLPALDNDSVRRGEPTNHIVFGEATALLAGDALLTESFGYLAKSYRAQPVIGLQLIQVLTESAGILGMIGGQTIDLKAKLTSLSTEDLAKMHEMKTGALIRACTEGAAIICGLPEHKIQICREFGASLGFAFQLKDDLLDSADTIEKGSWPEAIGLQKTKQKLEQVSALASQKLVDLQIANESPLYRLVQDNLERLK